MHTTIKLTDENSVERLSFIQVYNWLQLNIGPRLAWRAVRIMGHGWTIETASMLLDHLTVNIQDPSKAMLFMLKFGGETMPPEDLDIEWQNT